MVRSSLRLVEATDEHVLHVEMCFQVKGIDSADRLYKQIYIKGHEEHFVPTVLGQAGFPVIFFSLIFKMVEVFSNRS